MKPTVQKRRESSLFGKHIPFLRTTLGVMTIGRSRKWEQLPAVSSEDLLIPKTWCHHSFATMVWRKENLVTHVIIKCHFRGYGSAGLGLWRWYEASGCDLCSRNDSSQRLLPKSNPWPNRFRVRREAEEDSDWEEDSLSWRTFRHSHAYGRWYRYCLVS